MLIVGGADLVEIYICLSQASSEKSTRDLFPGPVSEAELMKGPRVARHLYAAVSVLASAAKKKDSFFFSSSGFEHQMI